ncbi:hypothetical protein [Nocardia abscessus]|uniref:hypothetical protein n=1 Tax=Nocardia abscessus TaxID=120957 RepID=UPI0024537840|nr:hypothetical protein [Nocardia abscessus]
MPDPFHIRVCLLGEGCVCPTVTLFLAPEPLIPGGNMLHLLEQAPLSDETGTPTPDAELIDLVQSESAPPDRGVRTELQVFHTDRPDPHLIHAILHDQHITAAAPMGLDVSDPAELIRLALLPEHPVGYRRIDDFQQEATSRAMLAVYRLFEIDQRVRLTYHGFADPTTGWFALRTAIA